MNTAVSPADRAPRAKARRPRPLPWLEPAVFTGSLAPVAVIGYLAFAGQLGANPISEALNRFGLLALVLIILSLACTPLKILFGWTWPVRIRKTLGLFGFFYALIHFLTYAGLDQAFDLATIGEDITKRRFIFVGFAALVLLVPLAVTSTAGMLKRMGFTWWKRLHRLAYLAGLLGCVHFVWKVKKDVTEPLIYTGVLVALLAIRVVAEQRRPAVVDRRPRDP